MSLPKDFLEQLPLKTDTELYDMLAHQEDYLPEALTAAKDELSKRNLAPERVAQIEATVQSQKVAEETKAQEQLGWPMRIFIFIFCAGLPGAVLAVYYDSKGYKRKASDCWITLGVSVAFHLVAGVVLYSSR
jgi:phosphotransferase system  glucose/maltose/N-acetylglucosamine-specific IIC component